MMEQGRIFRTGQLSIQISIIPEDDNEIQFGFGLYWASPAVFRDSRGLEQKLFCHKPGCDIVRHPGMNFFKDLFRIVRPKRREDKNVLWGVISRVKTK